MYLLICTAILIFGAKKLDRTIYKSRFGTIFENLGLKNRFQLALSLLYGIRRVMLSVIAIYLQKYSGLQIMIITYMNLFFCIYVTHFKPYKSLKDNKIACFNESVIYLLSILMSSFTDFDPSPERQYNIGWAFIIVCIICFIVNFWPVIYYIYR